MQIVVDGMLTHYERAGKGPIVLLLPGWADTSQSWRPVQQKLSQTFDVIVLDFPGFGGSQAPSMAWGLDDYVKFVAHFLEKLDGVEGNLPAIVGHSNGGAIAMRGMGKSKLRADKLILVSSAGVRASRTSRRSVLQAVTKVGKVVTSPLPAALRQKLRGQVYKAAGSDMLVAEHMQDTFKKIVTDDVREDAARVSVPTLLIYGDRDQDTPLSHARVLQQAITGSKLEVVPGASHFIHVEHPDEVSQFILGFLR